MLDDSSVICRVPTAVATDLGETVALLDDRDGYLELNPVGSAIWDAIRDPISFGALIAVLAAHFPVNAADIRRDVIPFVEELAQRGLATVS